MLRSFLPGWFPVQRCIECGHWYWGGLPWFGWLPAWKQFCCWTCAETNMDRVDRYMDADYYL